MKFAEIDRCAVPAAFSQEVREVKRRSGATLVSCDRSQEAEPILRRNGKMSQRQLWDGWLHRRPGFNPANPPGRSTHERRNDGVAYPGWAGMPLRYYQVGMDWDIPHVHAVVRAFAQIGWTAVVTYPTSARERQHVNVRRKGRDFSPFKLLKRGSNGTRVGWLRWALGYVHDPDTDRPYLAPKQRVKALTKKEARHFGASMQDALKRYQHDHGQKADGVYGPQTSRQLHASVRFRKRKDKK